VTPPPLCGTDWNPYSRGFVDSARIIRQAFDGAKITINPLATAPSDVWKRDVPQLLGTRAVLGVVDTAGAVQFGLQTASLSRAGDDGADRGFVAPDTTGIEKGLAAMKSSATPGVLEPDHTKVAPGAYPLTMLSYAAIKPLSLTTTVRRQFSEFLRFAATDGQVVGLELGKLPRGFAPLNSTMRSLLAAAATKVRTITAPPTTTTTSVYSGGGGGGFTPDTTPVTTAATTTTGATTTSVASGTTAPPDTAPPTSAELTPTTPTSSSRLVVPGLGLTALGSLIGAVGLGTQPRRRARRLKKAR
jgi:hypothetical protein